MAEAMDVAPLPPAEVGPGAVEQGQGGGDVVLPPLLVGHLHGPAVLEPRRAASRAARLVLGPSRRPPWLSPSPSARSGHRPGVRLSAVLAVAATSRAVRRATARRPRLPARRAAPPAARGVYAAARVGFRRAHFADPLDGPGRTHAHRLAGRAIAAGRPPAPRPWGSVGRVLLQALQADQLQVAGNLGVPLRSAAPADGSARRRASRSRCRRRTGPCP